MRCAKRNKRKFWYAVYRGSSPVKVLDDYGNLIESGEHEIAYKKPMPSEANISPSTGETEIRFFGTDKDYDRVITIDNPNTPINENAVLWLDTPLKMRSDETGIKCGDKYYSGYDFVVKRVSRYLTCAVILCTAVTAS